SHALVEIPACAVANAEINEALVTLRRVSRDALAAFSEIEIRVAPSEPRLAVLLVPRIPGGAGPSLKAVKAKAKATWTVAVRGEEGDEDVQRFPLPGGTHVAALPGVFTQVNWGVNRALVEAVVGGAKARGARRFVDAYA